MNKPIEKLRTYWDYLTNDGTTYQMGPQSHRVYLLDMMRDLGVKSFLDVGCGTGPLYQLIKESEDWDFVYKGTDYSEGMIEVCKKEFPEGDFEVEDARNLTESDNSWDAVVLMHCLDHLDNYQAAINEAKRVARRYVIIILWRGINYTEGAVNNLNDRSTYGREEVGGQWEDTFLHDFAWEPLKQAFDEAGLTIMQKIEGESINKEGRFNTLILLEK